jgi:hypothetical protein
VHSHTVLRGTIVKICDLQLQFESSTRPPKKRVKNLVSNWFREREFHHYVKNCRIYSPQFFGGSYNISVRRQRSDHASAGPHFSASNTLSWSRQCHLKLEDKKMAAIAKDPPKCWRSMSDAEVPSKLSRSAFLVKKAYGWTDDIPLPLYGWARIFFSVNFLPIHSLRSLTSFAHFACGMINFKIFPYYKSKSLVHIHIRFSQLCTKCFR